MTLKLWTPEALNTVEGTCPLPFGAVSPDGRRASGDHLRDMVTFARSMTVGRLAGVEIRIHWTWLLIASALTASVAQVGLPELQPGWSLGVRWATAGVISALFFLSLVLHELAHAVAARNRGLPVLSITLFLFGGVATIGEEPRSPQDELVIAAVGPIASFTLMFLFGALYEASVLLDLPVAATVFVYLAVVNLLVGAFNLLPGFPLDGGRMLRAVVWAARRNFQRATVLAGYAGRTLSGALVAGGLALVLWGAMGGAWLAFLGCFLWSAAMPPRRRRTQGPHRSSHQQPAVANGPAPLPTADGRR